MKAFEVLSGPMRQRRRRVWVVIACVDILLLSALAVSDAVGLHVVVLVGVVPILIALRLSHATAQRSSLTGQRLDERQTSVKHRAYMMAYRVSFAMAILAALSLYAIRVYTTAAFWGLFYGYFVLLTILPIMAIAWLEPDPIQDEVTFAGEPS